MLEVFEESNDVLEKRGFAHSALRARMACYTRDDWEIFVNPEVTVMHGVCWSI